MCRKDTLSLKFSTCASTVVFLDGYVNFSTCSRYSFDLHNHQTFDNVVMFRSSREAGSAAILATPPYSVPFLSYYRRPIFTVIYNLYKSIFSVNHAYVEASPPRKIAFLDATCILDNDNKRERAILSISTSYFDLQNRVVTAQL